MRRLLLALALFSLSSWLASCGAPATPTVEHRLVGEPSEGDEEGEPLLLGTITMPPLPVSVHASDEVVAEALRLSRDAVLPERPALADDATEEEIARYMREDFQAWMIVRARAIGAARTALGQMEHGEPDEYVLASALVGTLFSMLAREVQETPLPRVIRESSSQRVLVREALLEAAAPLYRRALDALGACASTAAGAADPTLDPWATYCDDAIERGEQAPRPVDVPPPPDAGTP
jgi:hypothetical protein